MTFTPVIQSFSHQLDRDIITTSAVVKDLNQAKFVLSVLPNITVTTKLSMIYRATSNGWAPADFHKWCDHRGRTVTFYKSSKGFLAGGYTSVKWAGGSGDYIRDTEAFVFSLTNKMEVFKT